MQEFRVVKWILGIKFTFTADDARKKNLRGVQAIPASFAALWMRVQALAARVELWIEEGIAIFHEGEDILAEFKRLKG